MEQPQPTTAKTADITAPRNSVTHSKNPQEVMSKYHTIIPSAYCENRPFGRLYGAFQIGRRSLLRL
jgi:hypothetical protein